MLNTGDSILFKAFKKSVSASKWSERALTEDRQFPLLKRIMEQNKKKIVECIYIFKPVSRYVVLQFWYFRTGIAKLNLNQ